MLATRRDSVGRKLPQITAMFWALKIACTTLGETGADEVAQTLHTGDFGEIILSTLALGASRWIHIDLSRRVAHLGLPVRTVISERKPVIAHA